VSFSGFDTPRIVKSPSTSKTSGAVCTILVERKVIVGLFFTSKNFSLFSLPFFMPLPVSTESASILMSRTPVVTSGDVNVRVELHLSNLPASATDAFTENLIVLS
jgi:hypothetical protein